MNAQSFADWLRGYLDAREDVGLAPSDVTKIMARLDQIGASATPQHFTIRNDPFHIARTLELRPQQALYGSGVDNATDMCAHHLIPTNAEIQGAGAHMPEGATA
jgi:hypothetical protein